MIVASGLELRAGPSFDDASVGAIAEGTVVQVMDGPLSGAQTTWYLVQPPRGSGIPCV